MQHPSTLHISFLSCARSPARYSLLLVRGHLASIALSPRNSRIRIEVVASARKRRQHTRLIYARKPSWSSLASSDSRHIVMEVLLGAQPLLLLLQVRTVATLSLGVLIDVFGVGRWLRRHPEAVLASLLLLAGHVSLIEELGVLARVEGVVPNA